MQSLQINYSAYKENVIIVGASQGGKTNLGKVMCKMLAMGNFNIVIRDVHRRFTNLDPQRVKTQIFQLTGIGLEIYQPVNDSDQDFIQFVSWCSTKHNMIMVVDELHNYCKKQKAPKELDWFCRNCNNRSMSYIMIFQAPAEIPNYVLRNANHRYCYSLDVPTDIDYMVRYMGTETKRFEQDSLDPVIKYNGLYKAAGCRIEEFHVQRYD